MPNLNFAKLFIQYKQSALYARMTPQEIVKYWHGSILGGSLKRSLGMAKLQKRRNHPQINPPRRTQNLSCLNHAKK